MRTVETIDLIQTALENERADIFTASIGEVISYDAVKRRAQIRLMIKRPTVTEDGTPGHEEYPILPSCPVLQLLAGPWRLSVPISPGVTGLVVFLSQDPAKWRAGGGVSEPGSHRRHALGFGVFVPGLLPDDQAIPQTSDSAMVLDGTMIKLGADAVDFVALASKVENELQNIETALSTHTHGGVTTGSGTSGAPAAPPYTSGSVGATKVKAK